MNPRNRNVVLSILGYSSLQRIQARQTRTPSANKSFVGKCALVVGTTNRAFAYIEPGYCSYYIFCRTQRKGDFSWIVYDSPNQQVDVGDPVSRRKSDHNPNYAQHEGSGRDTNPPSTFTTHHTVIGIHKSSNTERLTFLSKSIL